jgi:hypothetical protein
MTDKVVTLQSKNGRGRAGVYPMHTRPKLTGMEHFNLVHDVRDQLERGGMEWKDAADYSWLVGRWARKAGQGPGQPVLTRLDGSPADEGLR